MVAGSHRPGRRKAETGKLLQQQPLAEAACAGLASPQELVVQHPADEAATVIVTKDPALALVHDEARGSAAAGAAGCHGSIRPGGRLEQGGIRVAHEGVLV